MPQVIQNASALPLTFPFSCNAGLLNDLWQLDMAKDQWKQLGLGVDSGTPPSPRLDAGFAASADLLFVYGGLDDNGAICSSPDRIVRLASKIHKFINYVV